MSHQIVMQRMSFEMITVEVGKSAIFDLELVRPVFNVARLRADGT